MSRRPHLAWAQLHGLVKHRGMEHSLDCPSSLCHCLFHWSARSENQQALQSARGKPPLLSPFNGPKTRTTRCIVSQLEAKRFCCLCVGNKQRRWGVLPWRWYGWVTVFEWQSSMFQQLLRRSCATLCALHWRRGSGLDRPHCGEQTTLNQSRSLLSRCSSPLSIFFQESLVMISGRNSPWPPFSQKSNLLCCVHSFKVLSTSILAVHTPMRLFRYKRGILVLWWHSQRECEKASTQVIQSDTALYGW